jgi:hypothetical protein
VAEPLATTTVELIGDRIAYHEKTGWMLASALWQGRAIGEEDRPTACATPVRSSSAHRRGLLGHALAHDPSPPGNAEARPDRLEPGRVERQQLGRRIVEAVPEPLADPDPFAREHDPLHASVVGGPAALHEATLLEPVDEPGRHRRVRVHRVRDGPHRLRLVGVEQEQCLHVPGREPVLAKDGLVRAVLEPLEGELAHQPPHICGDLADALAVRGHVAPMVSGSAPNLQGPHLPTLR